MSMRRSSIGTPTTSLVYASLQWPRQFRQSTKKTNLIQYRHSTNDNYILFGRKNDNYIK